MSDLAVKSQNTAVNPKTTEESKKTPSTARMMFRYGTALPFAYEVYDIADTFIKAKKQNKTFTEVAGDKFFNNWGNAINKTATRGKVGIAEMIGRGLKIPLILTGIGIGLGVAMKKITDNNPDSKIVKAVNTTAKFVGLDFLPG